MSVKQRPAARGQASPRLSASTQELVNSMMKKSGVSLSQQRRISSTITAGGPLPRRCHPTSSAPDKPVSTTTTTTTTLVHPATRSPIPRPHARACPHARTPVRWAVVSTTDFLQFADAIAPPLSLPLSHPPTSTSTSAHPQRLTARSTASATRPSSRPGSRPSSCFQTAGSTHGTTAAASASPKTSSPT